MTVLEPYGVVGLITPWNFPLVTAVSKLGPALITGNCCILKPASCAPLTVLKLAEYCVEAGIPEGVVNIVTGPGSEVGEAIVTHLAFMGAPVEILRQIYEAVTTDTAIRLIDENGLNEVWDRLAEAAWRYCSLRVRGEMELEIIFADSQGRVLGRYKGDNQ